MVLQSGQGLSDFRQMAVAADAVGFEVIASFAQQGVGAGFAACTGTPDLQSGNQRRVGFPDGQPEAVATRAGKTQVG